MNPTLSRFAWITWQFPGVDMTRRVSPLYTGPARVGFSVELWIVTSL